MIRLSPAFVFLSGCVTHASVSTDALRYPAAARELPTVLAAVDERGREVDVEVRPDTRVTLHLADERLEMRARDLVLTDAAILADERATPWADVKGAELSEPRPWLAFAIVLGVGTLAGGALLLGGTDL